MSKETQSESGVLSGIAWRQHSFARGERATGKPRTRPVQDEDDILAKRLALVLLLLQHREDRVWASLALVGSDDGRQDGRREFALTGRDDGDCRDHELLVEGDDEFDEGVVEGLVGGVARSFDESEQVRDKLEREVSCDGTRRRE